MENKKIIKKIVAWSLLAVTLFYLMTGFAVTQFRVFTPLSGGILGKAVSQQVHEVLWIPFVILLVLHVGPVIFKRQR